MIACAGFRRVVAVFVVSATAITAVWVAPVSALAAEDGAAEFRVGVASRDITPEGRVPMWGYAARHDMLSSGVLDPLMAKAIVIQAPNGKVAIVGTDIGRGPTAPMMQQIREAVADKAGIEHVLICGSHSHHGPVIELTDREGFGRGKYDDAVNYSKRLPEMLIDVILEANSAATPARMGVARKSINYNRNRQSKREPKATDPMLAVIRFDDLEGRPIAVLVNFAAHPVMTEVMDLKFSADYVGYMRRKVEEALDTECVFIQGASGDMSPNPGEDRHGPEAFGNALGTQVLELATAVETQAPQEPSVQGQVDHFLFSSRINFSNPWLKVGFSRAFFPELVNNFIETYRDGIPAELDTVLINNELALVSGSGEFFCNHSNRLKERSYVDHTLFFGYCNGHGMYFPTIEAASEGGYGADSTMSPVELGAGEQMMNRALVNIYRLQGKFKGDANEE